MLVGETFTFMLFSLHQDKGNKKMISYIQNLQSKKYRVTIEKIEIKEDLFEDDIREKDIHSLHPDEGDNR